MLIALALALTLAADDLTPQKAAQVQHDRDKAMAEVGKKYDNKPSSQLSQDERREMIRDQRAAEDAVLAKHGVDAKELARYEAKMSLADRAATKAEKERLEKKDAEAQNPREPAEIPVQRGFSEDNPVFLEDKKPATDAPAVEKGLPKEALDDQAAASGSERSQSPGKPKRKSKK